MWQSLQIGLIDLAAGRQGDKASPLRSALQHVGVRAGCDDPAASVHYRPRNQLGTKIARHKSSATRPTPPTSPATDADLRQKQRASQLSFTVVFPNGLTDARPGHPCHALSPRFPPVTTRYDKRPLLTGPTTGSSPAPWVAQAGCVARRSHPFAYSSTRRSGRRPSPSASKDDLKRLDPCEVAGGAIAAGCNGAAQPLKPHARRKTHTRAVERPSSLTTPAASQLSNRIAPWVPPCHAAEVHQTQVPCTSMPLAARCREIDPAIVG